MTDTVNGIAKLGYTDTAANIKVQKDASDRLYSTVTKAAVTTALGYTPLQATDLQTVEIPVATGSKIGGILTGYTNTGANVAVQLSSNKAYVALTKSAVETALGATPLYTLPVANTTTLGGIKTGYTATGSNIKVTLDGNNNAYATLTADAVKNALGYTPLNTTDFTVATATTTGGIQIGYTQTAENRAVLLNNNKAYVNVPLATSTTYG